MGRTPGQTHTCPNGSLCGTSFLSLEYSLSFFMAQSSDQLLIQPIFLCISVRCCSRPQGSNNEQNRQSAWLHTAHLPVEELGNKEVDTSDHFGVIKPVKTGQQDDVIERWGWGGPLAGSAKEGPLRRGHWSQAAGGCGDRPHQAKGTACAKALKLKWAGCSP